jgi:hypothetical protein
MFADGDAMSNYFSNQERLFRGLLYNCRPERGICGIRRNDAREGDVDPSAQEVLLRKYFMI